MDHSSSTCLYSAVPSDPELISVGVFDPNTLGVSSLCCFTELLLAPASPNSLRLAMNLAFIGSAAVPCSVISESPNSPRDPRFRVK